MAWGFALIYTPNQKRESLPVWMQLHAMTTCFPPTLCSNRVFSFYSLPAMTMSHSLISPLGDESLTLCKHQLMRVRMSGSGMTTSRDSLPWGTQVQPRVWEQLEASLCASSFFSSPLLKFSYSSLAPICPPSAGNICWFELSLVIIIPTLLFSKQGSIFFLALCFWKLMRHN